MERIGTRSTLRSEGSLLEDVLGLGVGELTGGLPAPGIARHVLGVNERRLSWVASVLVLQDSGYSV